MPWLVLFLGFGFAVSAASASHLKQSLEPIVWSTTYTGTYSFSDYNRGYGRAEGDLLTQSEDFSWTRIIGETITPRANGTFTYVWTTELEANGTYDEFSTKEAGSVNLHCKLSTTTPKVEKRVVKNGTYNGKTFTRDNPPVELGWAMPLGGASVGLAPTGEDEIRVTGGADCPRPDEFLLFTPGEDGAEWQNLPRTQSFLDAFSATRTVSYNSLPFRYPMSAHEKRAGSNPQLELTSVTQLDLNSDVQFVRIRPNAKDEPPDKIGNLLLNDALNAIIGVGNPTGRDVPAVAPNPETIILPSSPGLGSVTTQVTGVLSGTVHAPRRIAGARRLAATPTLLENGSGTGTSGVSMPFRITPTAAGHSLLSGPHGDVTVTVSVKLTYDGQEFSGSRTAVVPGVTAAPTISSVTVGGTTQDPTFTIRGTDLGSEPAHDPTTTPSNQPLCPVKITGTPGYDYGTSLYLEDLNKKLAAGRYIPQTRELDCLALIVTRFTATEIDFHLGGFYQQFFPKYEISPGDELSVVVNGASLTVHVQYGKTVSS